MKNEKEILDYIKLNTSIRVKDISQKFFMSESTVRRKLTDLENKGLIVRTHGGAEISDSNNTTFNFTLRIHQNALEKKLIALKAIKLINEGDVIFLDGSTSTYFLAEYLSGFKNIKVITNGIDTLSFLAKKGVNALSTGGEVSKENTSVLIGIKTIDFIKSYNANICFFSCQSLDKDGTVSDCYQEENYVRREMIAHSDKSYFLCDSTKLDRKSPYILCNVKDTAGIIADKPLDGYFGNKKNFEVVI